MAASYQTLGELRAALRDMPDETPLASATVVMGGFYQPGIEAAPVSLITRGRTLKRCKCGGRHPDCTSQTGIVFY